MARHYTVIDEGWEDINAYWHSVVPSPFSSDDRIMIPAARHWNEDKGAYEENHERARALAVHIADLLNASPLPESAFAD